ncbi:hypothetical protein AAF712_007575 [Marasmius tenuissimus]|uniref:Myosin motor domain-containing protein n=1 Tax=Marasmius tenuissimus TaxID=585030 RepID=A0ABR2ZUK7_9AGAR
MGPRSLCEDRTISGGKPLYQHQSQPTTSPSTGSSCLVAFNLAKLFSGETDSEIFGSRPLAIKTILELPVSNPGKKGPKLASQIPAAGFVFEPLGRACTLFNPSASRFGKTLEYYLEKNDGASGNQGELAKSLSSLLFAWLNKHINQRLCKDDFSTSLSATSTSPTSFPSFVAQATPVLVQVEEKPEDLLIRSPTIQREGGFTLGTKRPLLVLSKTLNLCKLPLRGGREPPVRESADTMVGEESPFGKGDEAATKPGGCVAGEFRAALDTLFKTLDEAQAWHVFCVIPNDSQLPNQLEGRSAKGQVRSFGLAEIAKRRGAVFEVNMAPGQFCERYGEGMAEVGVMEGKEKERVQQVRTVFGLENMDIVLGNQQIYLSQAAFHLPEDQLRSRDAGGQKRNRAEAGLNPRALADPHAPYHSPGLDAAEGEDPWATGHSDAFNASSQSLSLVSGTSS